ncbi:glycosyltransferase [Ereboglobus luteus]|nr:glycosyltransferase [Ereboglobus luteus]
MQALSSNPMVADHLRDFLYVTDGRDYELTLLSAQSVRRHVPDARFHLIIAGNSNVPVESFPWKSTHAVSIDDLRKHVHYQVEGQGPEFHWGWGAAARWFVQHMRHIRQCVYLDSDILCLRPPMLTPVDTIAAVPAQQFRKERRSETADFAGKIFDAKKPLFETGMLVINAEWMRKVNFLSRIFDGAVETQKMLGKRFYAENTLLSKNFAGLIKKLPLKYNVGNNDVTTGIISEDETVFYHFHHEASGVYNKIIQMRVYSERNGRMNIAYLVDNSMDQISRMWMSMRSIRQFNKAVRFYVVSSIPLKGDFINLVVNPPSDGFAIYGNRPNTRFSDATMFRFYLTRLPVERLIYIDTDTICHGSLEPLWKMTKRKGIGMLRYAISDSETNASLKRKFYGDIYHNAGVLALNLPSLLAENFEHESLKWIASDDMPTEVFFADETVLNLRWSHLIYPIPEEFNIKFPLTYKGTQTIKHFYGSQKDAQIRDFSALMTP